MPDKVILTVDKGEIKGKMFEYTSSTRVFIGRQDDCNIVMPERTVSRYHCLLQIDPPKVVLQDFGSLNGTFLNGKMVGKREAGMSWEEAKDKDHERFELKDGDVLGLGSACEIRCSVERTEKCAVCGEEIRVFEPDSTAATGNYADDQGRLICRSCWKKLQEEKERQALQQTVAEQISVPPAPAPAQQPPAAPSDGKKKCAGCGKLFMPTAPDNNLCSACLADRAMVLDGVLAMLNINAGKESREDAVGAALIAGYDKVSLLGKGGMGEVWKVRERKTGRELALKTMLPDVAGDEHAKQLFLREAGICECLRHPNVVKAYKTGSVNGVFYILMDLCKGGSVDDLMKKKGGKLRLELATYIILQALAGLDYVHNMDISVEVQAGRYHGTREIDVKGIVHRDFKPGNIFLSDTGDHPTAMVADFGMAKAFDAAGKSQITKSGTVMGTPVFMPLQQARDCKYAKPEVDVWAAAASYYNMLTGKFAKDFRPGVNPWQVIIAESAIPIRKRNPDIPERMAAVIDKALVERPKIGYTSAGALRRDLIAALPNDVKDYCRGIL